jgi:hypothetical protein
VIRTHAWDDVDDCAGDTILELFVGDALLVSNDDDGERSFCSRIVRALDAGDYLIRASAFSGDVAGPNFLVVAPVVIIPAGGACTADLPGERCAEGSDCVDALCVEPG